MPLPDRPDERLLQALFDHARDGVLFADDDGVLLGANPAACRMLGHDAAALRGRRLGEFVEPASGSETRREQWDSFLGDGAAQGTVALRTGDGAVRFVEYNAVARVLPGVHLSLLRDVSDRLAAERERLAALRREAEMGSRLAMAVSLAGLGIARRSLDQPRTEVNENFARIVGREVPAEGFSEEEALAMVHPEDQASYLVQRQQALAGQRVQPVELRLRHADGSWRHVLVQRAIEHDADSRRADALLTITLDITSQRAAVQAREAQRTAEQANRAKSEFLSRMSHELRTPLNAILGFSEVLQHNDRHPLADEQRVQIRHIEKAGQHLLKLIDDLLDISRIEVGTLQLRLAEVDASAEVREAAQTLQADARGRQVELELLLPGAGVAVVQADRTRLRQVATNLLSNAIKYNRPGGRVSVGLVAHDGHWRLGVSDTGLGMTPDQLARLFQPFNRLGREAGATKGVGIGLAITRHLVEAMGGTLSVRSEAGIGSCFEVELAAVPRPPSAEAELPAPQPRDDVRGRVLYVEDDELNRALVRDFLALRPGIELLTAIDGRSGLAQARQQRPDLLLLDLTLPDMHGLEMLGAMQSDAALRDVPCVGLSAHAMPHEIEQARQAGMTGYLVKPLTAHQLLEEVDRRLAGLR